MPGDITIINSNCTGSTGGSPSTGGTPGSSGDNGGAYNDTDFTLDPNNNYHISTPVVIPLYGQHAYNPLGLSSAEVSFINKLRFFRTDLYNFMDNNGFLYGADTANTIDPSLKALGKWLVSYAQNNAGFIVSNQRNDFMMMDFQFISWAKDFLTQNPDTTWEQFENWFLKDIPDGFIQQIVLESPFTILNYISLNSPDFKMRRLDQIKYPKFTQMVKGLKTYVQSNSTILNTLLNVSGMNQSQILDKLTFGQGPQIELIPGLSDDVGPLLGAFRANTPNVLYVNENFALGIQQSQSPATVEATAFLLAVTILHEFVHYGNFLTGYDTNGQETGILFENQAYGTRITLHNAGIYSVKLINR